MDDFVSLCRTYDRTEITETRFGVIYEFGEKSAALECG